MCPRDDISFICAVTVSGNESLILLWLNLDDGHDRKLYFVNDTNLYEDIVVRAFTTQLVKASNDTLISTATINELNAVDNTSAGIICFDSVGNSNTLYVAGSGKKRNDAHILDVS